MSVLKKTALFVFSVLIASGSMWAATDKPVLKAGQVSAAAGAEVDLPIHFVPGSASVASMQFNITLPPKVETVSVLPEKALTTSSANKSVTQRLTGRNLVCMVFGLNQNKIGSGDLMVVRLRIDKAASPGKLSLPLSNVVYADPTGKVIPSSQPAPGSITVTSAIVTSAPK